MKFTGTVVHGVNIGTKFGIATANLSVDSMPSDLTQGVYFVQAIFEETFKNGLLHFGPRKTFGGDLTMELHLLDTDMDLYGKKLEIFILRRERDVEQFRNADALFTQIETDILKARKFFIRGAILQQWDEVAEEQREQLREKALQNIQEHLAFQNIQNVYVYAPIEGEINFVQKMCSKFNKKKYYFPKIVNGKMVFCESRWENLRPGRFGILEPISGSSTHPDLIFVPAVAVDKNLHRLGRGGGFYDRFLKDSTAPTITVVPKFAIVEKLPTDSHDIKVGEVIAV